MYVIKRDGRRESVKFDKITDRITELCFGLNENYIKPGDLAHKVILGLFDGVHVSQIDEFISQTAASLVPVHPDFGKLAARIAVSNLHKSTSLSFHNAMKQAYHNYDDKSGMPAPLISKETWQIVVNNAATLDAAIKRERDYEYDYFAIKTLQKSYLLKLKGQEDKTIETPQYMIMRVAIGIHGNNIERVLETYELMSDRWFTHATPTLFNAGTPKPQMSSCFLLTMKDDSIDGIYDTLKQCAKISQSAGGIGLAIHNIRAKGSYIKGTGGTSNGIVPMLRNFDMTARYVDQGGGKRKGSIAIYLEPWHSDIEAFLELKKNHGKEEMRARDLFYALWIPDLFMKRVKEDSKWSLFCPNEAPGLADVYGEEFEALYEKYEAEGKARKKIRAQELWNEIVKSQIETGTPYMLYKDACNRKSNQKNLGTIKSSNLCTEIIEYTSPDEVAVCNLASIALPKFVLNPGPNAEVDHIKLKQISYLIAINLNSVIDRNYYPVEEARRSNMRHRPIGIGVTGLADLLVLMRLPFDSDKARTVNEEIFETIYFGAMQASIDLAKEHGPYETFMGSPLSEGKFQFDLWDVKPKSGRWNWEGLREEVVKYGARNSLLLAPMPTASTAQILGYNECFEAFSSNLYTRRTLSGDFILVNKYLTDDLIALGMWNDTMKNKIVAGNGSIQHITEIPQEIRELYKTVWEISQKVVVNLALDRGPYICQSQSMNIHLADPTVNKISSLHFYAWERGIKTGMYYLRSTSAADAIKFTLNKEEAAKKIEVSKSAITEVEPIRQLNLSPQMSKEEEEKMICSIENGPDCEACSA